MTSFPSTTTSSTASSSSSDSTRLDSNDDSSLNSNLKGKGKEKQKQDIQSNNDRSKSIQVSQSNKAIAACTGAIAVSLLMTPFDVVKTRLQTQPPVPDAKLFIPDPHLHSNPHSSHSNHPSHSTSTSSTSSPSSSSSSSSTSRSSLSFNPSSSSSTIRSNQSPTNPATCCQQTYFTNNSHSSSLICRYDPRGIPVMVPENSVGRLTLPYLNPSTSNTSTSTTSTPSTTSSSTSLPPIGRSPHPSSAVGSAIRKVKIRAEEKDCAFPNKKEATKALKSFNEKANENRLKGLWDGVIKVGKGEGVRGLWRGLSPTLMMTVPSQVTYMTAYDYFRSLFLSFEAQSSSSTSSTSSSLSSSNSTTNSNSNSSPTLSSPSFSSVSTHTVLSTLTAGGIARALSATLVTPLELLRTRLQSSSSSSKSSRGGALISLIQEVRTSPQGIRILYRGLAPTLWRDVPFSAIYFAGYEFTKRSLTGNGLGESSSSSSSQSSSSSTSGEKGNGIQKEKDTLEEFSIAFLCGSISGTVAAVLTHPADVVKTRLQAQLSEFTSISSNQTLFSPSTSTSTSSSNSNPSASASSSSRSKISTSSTITRSTSTTTPTPGHTPRLETRALPTLRNLLRNEGLKGAFSGLSPRIAKIAPACGIMIGSFEVVGRALSDYDSSSRDGDGNRNGIDRERERERERERGKQDVWIEGEELGAR